MRQNCFFTVTAALATSVVLMASTPRLHGAEGGAVDTARTGASRVDKIPADIAKRGPDTDRHPPLLHCSEYQDPVPLSSDINTAGAEDSPVVAPDGNTLYFFFTPDVRVPPHKQLLDGVTGAWVSRQVAGKWIRPVRVQLQEPGKLALDSPIALDGDTLWFASAREGYTGVNMFTADYVNGKWINWTYCGDRLMKELGAGELWARGQELYYHSDRSGTKGGTDIWLTTWDGTTWTDPVNVAAVNSAEMESQPVLSGNGDTLWFTRRYRGTPAVFRSAKVDGTWQKPELIVSQFAGDVAVDDRGDLYFVHHYFEDGRMIEADIYVARRK